MLAPPPQPDFEAMYAAIVAAGQDAMNPAAENRQALFERAIREVRLIRADAMRAKIYSVRDSEVRRKAHEIRRRPERRLGQLINEMVKAGLRAKGRATNGFKAGARTGLPELTDLGVGRGQSQEWQKLGRMSDAEFEVWLANETAKTATTRGPRSAWSPKIHSIALSSISVSSRLRALRPDKVDEFAQSMGGRGLIHPITVRRLEDGGYRLIAGHHRLEAARKLGWESIPAIILKGLDAVDAELVEIDENLIRADLTPAEQAAHHARRKELHEQKYPETKRTATLKRGQEKAPSRQNGETERRYTKDTAEKTGASERTVQRHVERGTNIPNVSELSGTCLDQGAELHALVRLKDVAPDRQAKLIEQAKAGEKVSAKTEIKKVQRAKREAELGAKQISMPTHQHGVILKDYEWDDEVWSRDTGMDRHASNHYPTSKTAHTAKEIVAATGDRFACAAPDCVVFSWTTIQHAAIAFEVMKLRGFE